MRKRNFPFALIGALLLITACNKPIVNPEPEPEPEPTVESVAVGLFQADYLGVADAEGNHGFNAMFTTEGLVSGGMIVGTGVLLDLFILSPTIVDENPATGTYNLGTGAFSNQARLVLFETAGQAPVELEVAQCKLTITANTSSAVSYRVEVSLTDSEGIEYRFHYDGPLVQPEVFDYTDESESVATHSWVMNTQIDPLINYGDEFGIGVDIVAAAICSDNALASLLFYVPAGSTQLPVGSYTIDNSQQAMTVHASPGGSERGDYPSFVGIDYADSYYHGVYYLVSGTVVVSEEGFEVQAISYYGSTLSISHSGPLELVSPTGEAPSSAPMRQMKMMKKR